MIKLFTNKYYTISRCLYIGKVRCRGEFIGFAFGHGGAVVVVLRRGSSGRSPLKDIHCNVSIDKLWLSTSHQKLSKSSYQT